MTQVLIALAIIAVYLLFALIRPHKQCRRCRGWGTAGQAPQPRARAAAGPAPGSGSARCSCTGARPWPSGTCASGGRRGDEQMPGPALRTGAAGAPRPRASPSGLRQGYATIAELAASPRPGLVTIVGAAGGAALACSRQVRQ